MAKKREYTSTNDVFYAFRRAITKAKDAAESLCQAQLEQQELEPLIHKILEREGCAIESGGDLFRIEHNRVVVEDVKSSYSISSSMKDLYDPEPDEETAHENEVQDSIAAHERSLVGDDGGPL